MPRQADQLIPTRASLLGRVKNTQDNASWKEFFDTYRQLIYSVARKAGLTDAEAQDVVQETMASVAKHMPAFNYDPAVGSFKSWLLIQTRWRIITQLRKRAPSVECRPLANDTSTIGTDPAERIADPSGQPLDAMFEAEYRTTLINRAVAKVKRRFDPKKYQVFDFYVNKEWPPEKVAERFNISVNQVYLIKHRITEVIREEAKRLEKEMV